MITGTQLRMARAAVKLGVRDLAAIAKVSPATITRIEGGHPANATTLQVLATSLEKQGIRFSVDDQGRLGVALAKSHLEESDRHFVEDVIKQRHEQAIWAADVKRKYAERHPSKNEPSEP
ncbi:hypothetical protein Gxy13693_008_013 [Komagataeibacter xylinus NBRC 13693]|uniref:HTH cro/C1-type domain-containing protein n=2 Tax=Komagataeibacter xylinus TaxID=28448 RepID=A0A0D6Q5B3_KOMXY|nr:hypothetical protein Gxy13693_008_013 [Komagataeibacter xylinus NBRC 13693]